MPDLHLRLHDDTGDDLATPMPSEEEALRLLAEAEISAATLVPWGSNYTFAVALSSGNEDEEDLLGIYKPQLGERPLWDFPDGTLYQREVAAYRLSRRLGWDIVPPTVVREGPHGVGSLQLYIEPDDRHEDDYEFWGRRDVAIERMVLFDHITNNADRKLSHCLVATDGRVWGIDHGLTFNQEPKLRTVLWQFVGETISSPLRDDLERLLAEEAEVRADLACHLASEEVDAFFERVRLLHERGVYPRLSSRYNIPFGW